MDQVHEQPRRTVRHGAPVRDIDRLLRCAPPVAGLQCMHPLFQHASRQVAQQLQWPSVNNRDFLPYNDNGAWDMPVGWWTGLTPLEMLSAHSQFIGFYTSRPVLKGFSRYADYVLRVTEQLIALVWARYPGAGASPLGEFHE